MKVSLDNGHVIGVSLEQNESINDSLEQGANNKNLSIEESFPLIDNYSGPQLRLRLDSIDSPILSGEPISIGNK